jgi:4-amino-4-deoxy-L-arabinose transferase-like glycosyltransferase
VAVAWVNPEFLSFFLVHEHFQRFLTTVHNRAQPWWYFLPVLALSMLPWAVAAGFALAAACRKLPGREFKPARFLAIWSITILAFFSLSESKLPPYILPIVPALALLTGAWLARHGARTAQQHAPVLLLIALGLILLASHAAWLAHTPDDLPLYEAYAPWLRIAGWTALLGASGAWLAGRLNAPTLAFVSLALSSLLTAQIAITGHDTLSQKKSFYHLAKLVRSHLTPDVPFYSVGIYEQTLPFYLRRTVTLVAFADEMAYGLKQQPELWVSDLSEFALLWRLLRAHWRS